MQNSAARPQLVKAFIGVSVVFVAFMLWNQGQDTAEPTVEQINSAMERAQDAGLEPPATPQSAPQQPATPQPPAQPREKIRNPEPPKRVERPKPAGEAKLNLPPIPEKVLHQEMVEHFLRRRSTAELIRKWEEGYGPRAVPGLLEIALGSRTGEGTRQIAILAVTKIGGGAVVDKLQPLLKDPSPLVRYGALIAYRFADDPKQISVVSPLLNDPALLVRKAALDAISRISVESAGKEAVRVLKDPRNFNSGGPLSIVDKALITIAASQDGSLIPELCALPDAARSSHYGKKLQQTIQSLGGKPGACKS